MGLKSLALLGCFLLGSAAEEGGPAAQIPAPVLAAAESPLPAEVVARAETPPLTPPNPSRISFPAQGMASRRDPFLSPLLLPASISPCMAGKKCLEASQMTLRGTVESPSGRIAVVTNALNKTFFLREGDAILRGSVVRIGSDSIVLREQGNGSGRSGTTRETVKNMVVTGAPIIADSNALENKAQ